MALERKKVEYLVIDTTAFIENVPIHEVTAHPITCKEVVDEITNKRQLRRLAALPYDLEIKQVYPENIKVVTDFALKTGDYPSLSATDIKVMALTYQLEKEKVGTDHLRTEPIVQSSCEKVTTARPDFICSLPGFYMPKQKREKEFDSERIETPINETTKDQESLVTLDLAGLNVSETLDSTVSETLDSTVSETVDSTISETLESTVSETLDSTVSETLDSTNKLVDKLPRSEDNSSDESSDDDGWITPSNLKEAQNRMDFKYDEEKNVRVACMTKDFAMQNVLKQMNLNVSALDGRMIRQLRTFILRCYACFKTTSIMTKTFCPKCGNSTLKKVAVSLDENGKMQIHINPRKPLTGRGKKFSLPRIKGGKHPNNPILVADQPMPHNELSRTAKTKTDALHEDYIAGFSPFATKDLNSKSAQLRTRGSGMKNWLKKNPNESHKKRK